MEALRELRLRRGWSQEDLARKAGLTQDTISNVESGKHRPFPSTLRKIAGALEVEVGELFGDEPRPKEEAPKKSPREELEDLRRSGRLEVRVEAEDSYAAVGLEDLSERFAGEILRAVQHEDVGPGDRIILTTRVVTAEEPEPVLVRILAVLRETDAAFGV
jgi:transcriptional regulator with XRE-family HTH domain